VMLEAWSTGIPVITTLVGGIPEYFYENLGLSVENGNEGDLLKKLVYFMDNKDQFKKEDIREFAVDNFSSSVVGKMTALLY